MAQGQIVLDAPGIAKLAAQLAMLLKDGADLRDLRAQNAQVAKYFDQPGVFTQVGSVAVTGNVLYEIVECQQRQGEKYSSLVLVFDSASGSGRYRIDGGNPTPTIGFQVPAGGIVLTIPGYDNIRNFKLIAEAAQTLTFARALFL